MTEDRVIKNTLLTIIAIIAVALWSGAAMAAFPQLEWTYRIKPDAVPRSIVSAGENVLALQSEKFAVHFVDIATGKRVWMYTLDRRADIYPLGEGRALAVSDTLMHRLDYTAKQRVWSLPLCQKKSRALYLSPDAAELTVNCGAGESYKVDVAAGKVQSGGSLPAGSKQLTGFGLAEFNPSLLGGDKTLNIQGASVSLYSGSVQSLVWSYQAPGNFAPTAAVYSSKLMLLTATGTLLALDPATGREAYSLDLKTVIDMRFWDELPQRIDNYSVGRLFTTGGALYLLPPSAVTKLKILAFPPEIRLGRSALSGPEDDTRKWALNKAIKAWDSTDFRTALDGFKDASEIWPDSEEAMMFMGMAYSALREASPEYLDKAIECLEKARAIDPLNPDVSSNLIGNYLLKIFTYDLGTQRDKVVEYYEKMIAADPTAFVSHAGLADVMLSARDYPAAANAMRDSFKDGMFGPEQYALLVTALYLADERDEAAAAAETSMKLYPDSPVAFVLRAKLYSKEGRYKKALEVFKSMPDGNEQMHRPEISSYPRMVSAGGEFFFANALGLSGSYAPALEKLHGFINGLPDEKQIKRIREELSRNPESQGITIDSKFKGKTLVEIAAEYEMQLPAMMTAAHFHIRLGEKRQSVKLLEKAEKLAEGDSEAMSFIGYYYALNGVYLGRALQFTAQALKDRPEDSAYLRNYAVALWKNKRGDEAEKVFKKAIGKPAPVEFIFFDYGKFLLEAGRDKEAAAMFQKELEAEPELFEPAKALKAVSSKKPASRK